MPSINKIVNSKDNHISFQVFVFHYYYLFYLLYTHSKACASDMLEMISSVYFTCWQCENMATVERKSTEMKIEYVKSRVEEGGIYVDQVFFHDPDGSMIEICNCDVLPVVPLAGDTIRLCSIVNCNIQQRNSSGRFNNANEAAVPF